MRMRMPTARRKARRYSNVKATSMAPSEAPLLLVLVQVSSVMRVNRGGRPAGRTLCNVCSSCSVCKE